MDLVSHGVEKVMGRPFVLNKVAYAKKCIRNKFFDERNRKEDLVSDLQINSQLSDLEDVMIKKSEVKDILSRLGPEERELLYLWAVEDYTLKEIADETGQPKGTLTSRLFRLKNKLREKNNEPR